MDSPGVLMCIAVNNHFIQQTRTLIGMYGGGQDIGKFRGSLCIRQKKALLSGPQVTGAAGLSTSSAADT